MAKYDKRVTINDVARLAGVSSQTVSRVVNNHPYVSEDTRQRVQNAIRELDYYPNRVARSLVTQRTHMLGIISFGIDYYGPAQMVNNIERAAKIKGYGLSFSTVTSLTLDELNRAIEVLGARSVDGLLFITPVVGVNYSDLVKICRGVPFVQIDTQRTSRVPSVVIDQYYGAQLATQHLIDRGHRDICEISGPLSWFGAQARHQSWQDTLTAAGLVPGLFLEGDWTAKSGYEITHRLLAESSGFTALVAANDQMALGAIRALREHNLRVPDDVSIVGFDDVPEAPYFDPPLTTVRQDFAALGEQSVEYLVASIGNPDTPLQQCVLYPQLVERESTRPLE